MKKKILFKRLMFVMLQWLAFTTLQAQSLCSQAFTYTGAGQTFTVPSNVHQITVKLWGAGGAGGNYVFNDIGGGGGFATAVLNVNPGEQYSIIVGGGGLTGAGLGAYGGGGGKRNGVGGRGGGRSAIRNAADIELITAGAGGGGGGVAQDFETGGHGGGGLSGEPDNWLPVGGGAGTQTVGGAAGYNNETGCTCGGNPGSQFQGGYANRQDNGYNGSGGGGYYGGGSGTDYGDGAGGGGSSFIPDGGTTIAASSNIPGNIADPDYADNAGYGGAKATAGNAGRVVILWSCTCPAPTGMKVKNISDTSAMLKWDVAGADILRVKVHFRVVGDTAWAIRTNDAAKTKRHIHSLMPNTTYEWQLRSFCAEDTSRWVKGPDFTTYGAVVKCDTLPAALSQNLVAYYPFCGNANDISGHKNNPTFNNATLTTDRFGNANSAYSFNGNAQYIKGICSNYPVNSRTVSVWFKISDLSKHNEILGYGGGACGTSFFIALNTTNHANQYTATGHCENHNCSTPNSYPPPAGWNNLIITSGNSVTKFYLNGVLMDNFPREFSGTTVNGKDFAFGSISSPGGVAPYTDTNLGYLNGDLDDIVIYDTDLDLTQVQQLYQFFNGGAVTKSSGKITNSNESKEIPVSPGKLSLYPNPSMGAITIQYNSGNPGPITLNVYDFTNRKLFTKSSAAVKGMNTYHPDLTNFSPGIYYLELINNDEKSRIKFLIKK